MWGKAGERLTYAEALSQMQVAKSRGQFKELARTTRIGHAYKAWAAGRVRPANITVALDLNMLYGPEVDIECGGVEPMVDLWEAGDLYPTWPQLVALSKLTGFPLHFFAREPTKRIGFITHVDTTGCREHVSKFTPEALRAAGVGSLGSRS